MSVEIIVDRRKKRFHLGMDEQWNDPLGVDEAKKEKARTIEIPKGDKNPVYQVLSNMGISGLIGRTAYCLTDKQEMFNGVIQRIVPPDLLILRNKGVARIKDVISLGG